MRFTIRDLLWLTVVVALGVSWVLDRGRLGAEIERLSPPYFPPNFARWQYIRDVRLIPPDVLAPATNPPKD